MFVLSTFQILCPLSSFISIEHPLPTQVVLLKGLLKHFSVANTFELNKYSHVLLQLLFNYLVAGFFSNAKFQRMFSPSFITS